MTLTIADLQQEERARRHTILRRILILCSVTDVILLGLLLILGGVSVLTKASFIELLCLLVAYGFAAFLHRAHLDEPATHVVFVAILAATIATTLPSGTASPGIPTLFIPIVGAPLLLHARWSFVYAALSYISYLVIISFGTSPTPPTASIFTTLAVLYAILFAIVATISWLSSQGYQRQFVATLTHAAELETARADLERRVEERTRDVQQAMEDLRRSAATIHEMSAPVVPISDGILALTLIGSIDSARADLISRQVLDAVHERRARVVLVDITGVPIVDTQVAGALLKMTQGVRMLGAQVILVGIRAEVANTLVGLGVDMGSTITRRDLHSGLLYALEHLSDENNTSFSNLLRVN